MGTILNPRGTAGAGKTEFVRRILGAYGWGRAGIVEPVHSAGRPRPIAYRVLHPRGGRPLAVLGHYEATCGGVDTFRAEDGGLDAAFDLADRFADEGHDVLLEGLLLSQEVSRTAVLGERHDVHVLRLATSPELAVRQLAARRRAGRRAWEPLSRKVMAEKKAVDDACERLRSHVDVAELPFDDAFERARRLLGMKVDDAIGGLHGHAAVVPSAKAARDPMTPSHA